MANTYTDQWFQQAFDAAYSSKTAASYVARMRALVAKTRSKSFLHIITHPDHHWPAIRDVHYKDSIGTRRSLCTLVLAAFKLLPESFRNRHALAHDRWRSLQNTTRILHEADRNRHELTNQQKKAWVSLNEIREKASDLARGDPHASFKSSLQFLLVSIYASMPPKRSDLGNVRIVSEVDPFWSDQNYFVLDPQNGMRSFLVLNVYKTAKRYGRLVTEFPRDITAILKESIRKYPRGYMFVDRHGKPYNKNASYGAFVRATFNDLFGKATGTSLLRHIYITDTKLFDSTTPDDIRQEAHRQMAHDAGTSFSYRKKLLVEAPKNCSCICDRDD